MRMQAMTERMLWILALNPDCLEACNIPPLPNTLPGTCLGFPIQQPQTLVLHRLEQDVVCFSMIKLRSPLINSQITPEA